MGDPENRPASSKAAPVIVVLIGVALAAATVYAIKTSYVLRYELKQKHDELEKQKQANTNATELVALQQRLQETETELTRLRQQNERMKQQPPAPASVALVPPPVPVTTNAPSATSTNRVSWLDRIREEDPERYKQVVEAREQRRQQMETAMQEQFTRLDERLKTAQTQEEADLISQISVTLQKVDELRQKWETVRQLPEEERRAQAQELGAESWQTYQTLTQLRAQDRQMQLQQLATQIGYRDPKDAQAFVDSLNRIYTDTDTSMGRFMGFGRGGQRPQ